MITEKEAMTGWRFVRLGTFDKEGNVTTYTKVRKVRTWKKQPGYWEIDVTDRPARGWGKSHRSGGYEITITPRNAHEWCEWNSQECKVEQMIARSIAKALEEKTQTLFQQLCKKRPGMVKGMAKKEVDYRAGEYKKAARNVKHGPTWLANFDAKLAALQEEEIALEQADGRNQVWVEEGMLPRPVAIERLLKRNKRRRNIEHARESMQDGKKTIERRTKDMREGMQQFARRARDAFEHAKGLKVRGLKDPVEYTEEELEALAEGRNLMQRNKRKIELD